MAAVTLVTVQKELFKNVAEILLEARAAGNLISERLVGEQKRRRKNHPSNSQGGAGTGLVLRKEGSSGAVCFYKLLWGLLYCPPGGQGPLRYLDLEREKREGAMNE